MLLLAISVQRALMEDEKRREGCSFLLKVEN
jgi:hypothetical protein